MGDKRVTIENKRLLALFDGADENKMDFVRENVRQLSWYNVRIRDLQKAIDEAGTKEHYQHGREQSGNHANPDIRTLIDLQKLTNAIVKVLLPLVPEKQTRDELDDFLNGDYDSEYWEKRKREDEERQKKIQAEIDRAIELQRQQREQANSNHV